MSELSPTHIQDRQQAFDDLPGRVPLGALNSANVGAIDTSMVGKPVLGKATILPELSEG